MLYVLADENLRIELREQKCSEGKVTIKTIRNFIGIHINNEKIVNIHNEMSTYLKEAIVIPIKRENGDEDEKYKSKVCAFETCVGNFITDDLHIPVMNYYSHKN